MRTLPIASAAAPRTNRQRKRERGGEMEPRRRPHPPGGPAGLAAGGLAPALPPASAPGAASTGAAGAVPLPPQNLAPPPPPPPPPGYAAYAGSNNPNSNNTNNHSSALPQAADGPPELVKENATRQHQLLQQGSPGRYGSHGAGTELEGEDESSELSTSLEMDRMLWSQARGGYSIPSGGFDGEGGGSGVQQQQHQTSSLGAVAAVNNNPLSSPAAARRMPGAAAVTAGSTPRASGSGPALSRSSLDMNGGAAVYGNGGVGSGGGGGLALTTPVVARKPSASTKTSDAGGSGVAFAAPPQTAPRGGATSKPPLYTPAGVALARNPHLNLNVTPNTAAAAAATSTGVAAAANTSGGGATGASSVVGSGGDGTSRRRDTFSPATVQLARTLDNLMDDDDDDGDDNDGENGVPVVAAQQGHGQRQPNGTDAEANNPRRLVETGKAVGGGSRGGGSSALDALAAAIHASPRRAAVLGDNSTIAATAADLSLSSSSADPSPIRTARGIAAGAGTGMEDWSSVYPYENDLVGRLSAGTGPPGFQQQQHHNQNSQDKTHQSSDVGATPMSFGAFSPPAKSQQLDRQASPQQRAETGEVGGGSGQQQQQQRRTRSSDSPDAEMTQLQQQFNQLGQPNVVPPQQYPGPHRGWMGGQSPNLFGQSPVPPEAGLFGGAGMPFFQDSRQVGMSPMNVPPLPSGIMSPVPMSPHGMSPVTVPVGQMAPSPVNIPVFNAPGQNFGLPPIAGAGPGLWSSGPSTQQQQGFGSGWGTLPGVGTVMPPAMSASSPVGVPPMAPSPFSATAPSPVPPHGIMIDPSLSAQAGVFHPQTYSGPDSYASQQSQHHPSRQIRQVEEPQLGPRVEGAVPSRTKSKDEAGGDGDGVATSSLQAARDIARSQKVKLPKKGKSVPDEILDSPRKGRKQHQRDDIVGATKQADPGEQKKAELNENPQTKLAFKEFYRKFHALERTSLSEAQQFAMSVLEGATEGAPLPGSVHWRVYLELADLAKRSNKSNAARSLYAKVCELQPYTPQGWLEYSKLEEECGDLPKCQRLLYTGLRYCEFNESLMTRTIKHEEKTGNLAGARSLLARLKHAPGIEKVWRTVLEGALFEARSGNPTVARRLLKYLMHHVPWYGPLYLEAYKLERDTDNPAEALAIVERGLGEIPRYGPLWFGAFRLCEGMDLDEGSFQLPRTMKMIARAQSSISRELLWKVHLEAAQAMERAAVMFCEANPNESLDVHLKRSRTRFAKAAVSCPPNLVWKVWLAGGKMELTAGRFDVARTLFHRASDNVPEKGRSAVFLEHARLEEFVSNMELARAILCKARNDASSDWKIWLESVNVEIRCKMYNRAARVACEALKIHTGTGRLWAALVQLRHREGEEAQLRALRQSLRAVPKSGEVWGEGARVHLNPFSPMFDLERADQHLIFATKFTPQYGDSFLETLRLELMQKWVVPGVQAFIDGMEMRLKSPGVVNASDVYSIVGEYARVAATTLKSNLLRLDDVKKIDTYSLELRCSNADPNYGKLWFRCRTQPADTARNVLVRAKFMFAEDLAKYSHIYVTAILRRIGAAFLLEKEIAARDDLSIEKRSFEWDTMLDDRVRNGPTLGELLTDQNGMAFLDDGISGADFTSGLFDANGPEVLESLSLTERRKLLFGSDLLLSWKSP